MLLFTILTRYYPLTKKHNTKRKNPIGHTITHTPHTRRINRTRQHKPLPSKNNTSPNSSTLSGRQQQPPPPPQKQANPSPSHYTSNDSNEGDPDKRPGKRKRSQSNCDKKNADKPAKNQNQLETNDTKKRFNCYTINIRGLTQQKWLALLQHPALEDPHAIIITEHHLPFGHTPTYAQTSGWQFHTLEAPYKTDKKRPTYTRHPRG